MPSYHAVKSPSSSDRWGGYANACTASIQAQVGIPGTDSVAASTGTCGHQLCAEVLMDPSIDPQSYLNRKMLFWFRAEDEAHGEDWSDLDAWNHVPLCLSQVKSEVVVTQDLIDACVAHINMVRETAKLTGAQLFAEECVPIDHITGEAGATGTSDVVMINADTCTIIDLKLGRSPVSAYEIVVPAHTDIVTNEPVPEKVEPNSQLAMYGSGTLRKFADFADFKHVVLIISQPFLNKVSQWSGTVAELEVTIDRLRHRAKECDENPKFCPTADNCHFCRASGNCDAQDKAVMEQALIGFDDVTSAQPKQVRDIDLGTKYALVPMVQDWCKAIEARTMESLRAGLPVSRSDGLSYKLVVGKKGDRSWVSDEEAITTMKGMRLQQDQMFKQVLLGPAAIEKLAKVPKVKKGEPAKEPVLSALRWTRLQKLITQADGKPVIALETDPRPAVAAATDGFEDVPPVDNTDLF